MKQIFIPMIAILTTLSIDAKCQEIQKFPKTINVAGTAEMEVVPDEIYVIVELREYDKKGGSKVDITALKNDFIKTTLATGIPETDISVQGYQGWDGNYWLYKRNKKKNPDLKASITYQVKLSTTKKMDELVEKLDDEATQNFYIARVAHSKVQEYKKQLKIQAVKAAKDKAIYLADAIGEKVGEAITINDPNEVGYYPAPMYANKMMKNQVMAEATQDAGPQIDFKKIKLQFDVNVVFALK